MRDIRYRDQGRPESCVLVAMHPGVNGSEQPWDLAAYPPGKRQGSHSSRARRMDRGRDKGGHICLRRNRLSTDI